MFEEMEVNTFLTVVIAHQKAKTNTNQEGMEFSQSCSVKRL